MIRRILALLLLAATSAEAAVTLMPAGPSANRLFSIRTTGLGCGPFTNQRAIVSGSVITVAYEEQGQCFPEQPAGATDVAVTTSAPAGTYEVRLREEFNGAAIRTTVVVTQLVVRANDFTGLWYDSAAPGWGLHVAQGDSGTLFATWFSYSATATPAWNRTPGAWYFAPGAQVVTSTEASGQLYLARSGSDVTPVGTMSLRLPADGQLDVQVTGALFDGATKHLRRLEF